MDNGLLYDIYYGEIILPDTIHIAVGRQCNIWWSTAAVYEEGDRSIYFEVKCDIGITTARGFTVNATADMIGEHTLTVRSRDLHTRRILSERVTTVAVVPTGMGEGHKNIMMIGDSRAWHSVDSIQGLNNIQAGNKTTTAEVRYLLHSSEGASFTFIGDHTSEIDPNVRNFADSGRKYEDALSILKENGGIVPFVTNNCGCPDGTVLDYVTIMFGINDMSDWHQNNLDQYEKCLGKIDGIIDSAKGLIDAVLEGYPNCRIILALESSTAANQDGYGYWGRSDNDCGQEIEFAVKALRKRTIAEFDNGKYSDNVTLSSAGLWCDRLYGYPYVIEPASARSESSRVMHLTNCVHPHNDGYRQIADGYFSTIEFIESIGK